jgi:hypothetical protein
MPSLLRSNAVLDPIVAERLMNSDTYAHRQYDTMPQGSLLKSYANILTLLDSIGDVEKRLNEIRAGIKDEFIRRSSVEGIEKFSGDGLTITVRDKSIVKYDPEKWDDILKALVAGGYGYCVHRRLSEGKVQELMDSGVRLPDGIAFDSIKEVSHRRI